MKTLRDEPAGGVPDFGLVVEPAAEKMLYGKKSVGVIRSTLVVGLDGAIEQSQYGVKATGHVARLRKELGV